MHGSSTAGPRRSFPGALLIPVIGLVFAFLFAAQNVYRGVILGEPIGWRDMLANTLPRFLAYSLLAPLVGWLVERAPVGGANAWRALGVQIAGGVTFAIVHSALIAMYFAIFHLYPAGETLVGAFRRLMVVHFGMDLIVFAGITGAYHAQRYVREVRERDRRAAALEQQLTAARLDALRSQLNPHFLFNTLNVTSAMALAGERDRVVETLGSLGQLLRVSLDPTLPQLVPLEREMALLDAYLDIQRVRFGERLTIDWEVAADARAVPVPSMLLQPLVENALQHGIAERPGPGRVGIHAARREGRLMLRIEDDGPGFNGADQPKGHGVGLGNTRARLAELYGDRASLRTGNRPDGGAFVAIELPAEEVT
ncbi:MAG TPA: sensor histidine kinase, partial [Candidatus Eisenbacteria bacterium]